MAYELNNTASLINIHRVICLIDRKSFFKGFFMSGEKSSDSYKRARTSSQKAERRTAILEAAERHLRTAGFENFSMGKLAEDVGIARGTLYLYFDTREEVLLALYTHQLTAWCDAFLQAVDDGMDDESFLQSYLKTARRDPLFLQLATRLGDVIEHNVSTERLIESKRTLHSLSSRLTGHISRALHLSPKGAFTLLISLSALLLGASQIDSGPSIDPEILPADISEMVKAIACDDVFLAGARLILSGLR